MNNSFPWTHLVWVSCVMNQQENLPSHSLFYGLSISFICHDSAHWWQITLHVSNRRIHSKKCTPHPSQCSGLDAFVILSIPSSGPPFSFPSSFLTRILFISHSFADFFHIWTISGHPDHFFQSQYTIYQSFIYNQPASLNTLSSGNLFPTSSPNFLSKTLTLAQGWYTIKSSISVMQVPSSYVMPN